MKCAFMRSTKLVRAAFCSSGVSRLPVLAMWMTGYLGCALLVVMYAQLPHHAMYPIVSMWCDPFVISWYIPII